MSTTSPDRVDEARTAASSVASRPPGRARPTDAWRSPVLGLVGLAGFVLSWQLLTVLLDLDPRNVPGPRAVLSSLVDLAADGAFWGDLATTMQAWAIGVGVAVAGAIVLGVVIGSSSFLRRATRSTIEFLRPIPSVALIPVVVLLFGFETTSSVVLVIKAAFWPTLLQALYGVADVDQVAAETARSFRFGHLDRARYVVLPSALPYVLTGIRLSCAIGLVITITAELLIPAPGIGTQIGLAEAGGATDQLYALIVLSGLIGLAVNLLVRSVERRVLHWHTSARREVMP